MPRENPHRPFNPDPSQMALFPAVSGNTINGLGEEAPRRPSVVYWAPNPMDIPHGPLQLWFYKAIPDDPGMQETRTRRQEILEAPLPPVAPERTDRTPDGWTGALDQFVTAGHCEMTGVAEMQADWIYQDTDAPQSRIVMIGVQHDYDAIETAPNLDAAVEVMTQYARAAAAAKTIAGWLRQQGWDAEPLTGPMTSRVAMIPPALACGFGELGKHGSIINPEFGASFRLSAVLTDAPFAITQRRTHGIDDFCQSCRICEDACPPLAIAPEKQTVRGTEKWYVDFDRCLPFFNETQGCAICIAVCPWSRPGIGPSLAAKLARRAERLAGEPAS